MSKRDHLLLVEDMLEAAEKIMKYVHTTHIDDFLIDEKTKDAVIRNFEIIGEAASRLSAEYKKLNKKCLCIS